MVGFDSAVLRRLDTNQIYPQVEQMVTNFPGVGHRGGGRNCNSRHSAGTDSHPDESLHVFFESTREEKIRRIKTLSCSCFIDDLEEIFLEPSFPAGVQQCLFDPLGKIPPRANIKVFRNWREITRYFVTQIAAVKVLN